MSLPGQKVAQAAIASAIGGILALASPAWSQEAPGEPPRFSQGFELRTGEEDAAGRADIDEPLTPEERNASGRFVRDLEDGAALEPDEPIFRAEEEADDAAPEAPGFDLFSGPAATPAARQNLAGGGSENVRVEPLDTAADAVSRLGDDAFDASTDAAEADGLRGSIIPQPDLFAPAGPVRSPSSSEFGVAGRLDGGLGSLRRSFPLSADDPFAPVGIRAGRFVLFPVLEQSVGYSDNLTSGTDGEDGLFSQTTISARLLSDWSRHEAEVNAAALYRRNFAGPLEEEPRVDLDGRLRLDIDRDLTATLRGALAYAREDPALSDDPFVPSAGRPHILTYSAGAELRRDVARTSLSATGDVVHEDRDDVRRPGSEGPGESFTTYTAGLRAGYDFAPLLKPFVAGSIGRRAFEDEGADGLDRGSLIPALRAGLAFDLGEKLYGEIALGHAWNVPDEDGFETTGSPTVDARLNWSPRRGTDVLFAAETFFEPAEGSVLPSTLYQGSVALRHRARARTDFEARLVAAYRDSDVPAERDTTLAAEGGLTYWLNRQLALTGLLRHERFEGEEASDDYTANSVRLGLRLQR